MLHEDYFAHRLPDFSGSFFIEGQGKKNPAVQTRI